MLKWLKISLVYLTIGGIIMFVIIFSGLKDRSSSRRSNYTYITMKVTSRPKDVIDYEKGHNDLCKNSWQENYTKLHQYLVKTNQKFVVYKCRGKGWGNRVPEMLLYFHFAVIAKRAFLLDCNNPSPVTNFLLPRNIKWNHPVNRRLVTIRYRSKVVLDNITDSSDPKVFDQLLKYDAEYNPNLVGNRFGVASKVVKYDLSVWPNERQVMGCNFYYLFKKSDMLQKRLNEWKEELGFNENIVIGIHIREGDIIFYNNTRDKRFKNEEDIDFSFICAQQIQKAIETKYNTDKVIWFLAADSAKRKDIAKQKYGSKVRFITGPVIHVNIAKRGEEMRQLGHLSMFLDFFLLQEADYRLYTSHSSFDVVIDTITLGTNHSSRTMPTEKDKPNCVIPPSLKD